MDDMGQCVEKIAQNGFCLIESIATCLQKDLSAQITTKSIVQKIFHQIKGRVNFHAQFLPNYSTNDIIKDVCKYLNRKEKYYTLEVVDIVIGAAANTLNVNIKIFQNSKGFKNVLEFQPERCPSISAIFLLLTRDAPPDKDPKNINSHYDAVVLNPKTKSTNTSAPTSTSAATPKK